MARPKGLGRGLDALLGAAIEPTGDRLETLALEQLQPGKYQPRTQMDDAALHSLAESIRAQGIIQPVLVRALDNPDAAVNRNVGRHDGLHPQVRYEIIAGERRWRAARLAGLREIPVVVRSVPDNAALAMALIENIQREALNPLEEALGLQRLIEEFGLTHEACAQAVGKSRSAVSNLLRLLQLADPVRELIFSDRLEMGHARALLPLPVLRQMALARQSIEEGWSVREVEKRVQREMLPTSPQQSGRASAKRAADPDLARLEEDLSDQLGATVKIQHGKQGRGRLSIDYSSLDQLDQLLRRLRA